MAIEGPKAVAPGEFRGAMELVEKVFSGGRGAGMQAHYPLLLCEENARHLRIFTDDGRAVALVGMLVRDVRLGGSVHRACCIGAVCTDPDYRNQGFGTRLMEDSVTTALADGVDLFFISGSRGLYVRLGYLKVTRYRVHTITPDRLPAGGPYALRRWQPEDLPALVDLHAAEPVRFVRPPEDFLPVLESGNVTNVQGDTELVCVKDTGRPAAYLSYQIGGRGKAKDALTVTEVAGSRWAVAHGLHMLLERRGADGLELHTMDCDREMGELSLTFGWPSQPRDFRGTVGIVDPVRFWEACRPRFAERLGARRAGRLTLDVQDGMTIRYGEESLALEGMTALTGLVFQQPERREELALDAGSELRRVLEELFPLPLVDYGLNYI